MIRIYKSLLTVVLLIMITGCSIPEFYLDMHYPSSINLNEPLPIDIFITNSRIGTTVHIESIQLSGELVTHSQLVPGHTGLYRRLEGSDSIIAEPNRRLIQFETGTFSLTIRPEHQGVFQGNFTFYMNGGQISREITVEVK